jgi:hypothetical protein
VGKPAAVRRPGVSPCQEDLAALTSVKKPDGRINLRSKYGSVHDASGVADSKVYITAFAARK